MMELTETVANSSLNNEAITETTTLDHQDQDTNERGIVTIASSEVIDRGTIEQTSLPGIGPYRGFSTSMCDLFNDPQDCCAFFCCGAFISDRTYYLFHEGRKRRAPFYKRIFRHFLVPLLIFIFATLCYHGISDVNVATALGKTFTFLLVLYIAVDLNIMRQSRVRFRMALLGRLRGDTVTAEGDHHHNITQRLQDNYHSTRAHKLCCGCYSDDKPLLHDNISYQPLEQGTEEDSQQQQVDFCTGLWRFLASMCCGTCCRCWCQCCGICAMAQEAREIKRIVPKQSRMIDFITFEPYTDYFSKILALRSNKTPGFCQHLKAISKLSRLLLTWLGVFFSIMVIFAIIPADKNFTLKNFLVLIATFFQAILILYFVYWKNNRYELSLDAVIKYFASGFLFSVGVAMVSEMIVQVVLNIVMIPLEIAEQEPIMDESSEEYVDDTASSPGTDKQEIYLQWARSHPFFLLFNYFLASFCVAALVEELCKYFGYLIVEHPDFTSLSENVEPSTVSQNGEIQTSNLSNSMNKVAENFFTDDDEEEDPVLEAENSLNGTKQNSIQARIMAAMVATAVGFACCENLMYVFSAGSFISQIAILLTRSILPVHPLAAAIQSIGVCHRDLEGNEKYQIGRIIFPAIILHGSFDFFVFTVSIVATIASDSNDDDTNKEMDIVLFLIMSLGCILIMGLGVAYYVKKSNSLKTRLMEMDRETAAVRSSLL